MNLNLEWELQVREVLGDALTHPLVRPHARFRYPEVPLGAKLDRANSLYSIHALLTHLAQVPVRVRIDRDRERVLLDYVQTRALKAGARIGLQRPCPAEFLKVCIDCNLEVRWIPRDPEEWSTVEWSVLDELWISNPSSPDGFFYAQTHTSQLLAQVAPFRQVHVLSDESSAIFSFNQEPPGSFKSFLGDRRVSLMSSLYPILNPQGPEIAWILTPSGDAASARIDAGDDLTPEDADRARLSLQAFLGRQGQGFSEFTRRMIALSHGLRFLTDHLKSVLHTRQATLSPWPETGFFLMLYPAELKGNTSAFRCLTWTGEFARRTGVLLMPGSYFGAPDAVQLCYAAPHRFLQEAAVRIQQGFDPNPGNSSSIFGK